MLHLFEGGVVSTWLFRIPLYMRFVSPVSVLIQPFICIRADSRTFIIQLELLSILHYSFCCSDCPSVSQQGLSAGTCLFDTAPLFAFQALPDSLDGQDSWGGGSYVFPPPSWHWPWSLLLRMGSETQIQVTAVCSLPPGAVVSSPLERQNWKCTHKYSNLCSACR